MQPHKKNTFCHYPFQQLALKHWEKGKGITNAAPCCNAIRVNTPDPLQIRKYLADADIKPTADEIFHGPEMEEVRQSMLDNKRHPACQVCWEREDRNPDDPNSYRFQSAAVKGSSICHPELRSLDLRFGEDCNLRCRICVPGSSNKLRQDFKYFHDNKLDTSGIPAFRFAGTEQASEWDIDPKGHQKVHRFDADSEQWQNILDNVDKLTEIKATGGETTISKPFIELLEHAIEKQAAPNITLNFHTNATKFTDKMVDMLQQFDEVTLICSIDSYGKNYEYNRYPMKWDKLEKSLRNLLTKTDRPTTNLRALKFTNVLSVLNAFHLRELDDFQIRLQEEFQNVEYRFVVDLLDPEDKFVNVKYLPPALKVQLLKEYSVLNTRKNPHRRVRYDYAIQYLEQWKDYDPTEQDRQNMLREITLFDQSRSQSYRDYLDPALINFLETLR